MASRVNYAVSCTPIFTNAAGEGVTNDVIASDILKSLGGSGSQAVTWGTTVGYTAGAPTYIEGNGGNSITTTSAKFLYIRNTGYTLSGGTLGVATADILTIMVGGYFLAIVPAKSAIILPLGGVGVSQSYDLSSSDGSIAVEYFWTA